MMNQVRCLLIGACLATGLAFNAWAKDNGAGPARCNDGAGEMYSRTELFFGLSKPSRPYVTDQQFQDFVDTEVTPRFPDGLTLLSGIGQYQDWVSGNIVQEKSRVLILLYPPSADSSLAVDQIRDAYVRRFDQMGVLRVDGQSCVTF